MPETIIMYGTDWCSDCHRSRRLLDRHKIPYTWVDVDKDKNAREYITALNHGRRVVPTIVFPDGDVLFEPSDAALAEKTGAPA